MTAAGDQLLADLAARLDADERAARAATPGSWSADPTGTVCADTDLRPDGRGSEVLPADGPQEVAECYRNTRAGERGANAEHIARQHPERVLRDVTAVRAVMGMYEQVCQTVRERAGSCQAAREDRRRDGLDRLDIDYASAVARKVALADCLTALAAATVRPEEAPTP